MDFIPSYCGGKKKRREIWATCWGFLYIQQPGEQPGLWDKSKHSPGKPTHLHPCCKLALTKSLALHSKNPARP